MAEWVKLTTPKNVAHLWQMGEGRFGAYWDSKCGKLHSAPSSVYPPMKGDRECRQCFPSKGNHNG